MLRSLSHSSLARCGFAPLFVGLLACGSEVTNIASTGAGGSGGGTGGAASNGTETVSTVATVSTVSTVSSSSTGGGSTCDQACAKIANECGFGDVCSQIPVLNCADPMSECPGACVLEASCIAIASLAGGMPDPKLVGCVQACQGGGQGGSGQGGGPPGNCQNCVSQNCGAEFQKCQGDKACGAFLQCAQGCKGDQKCVADCGTKNPSDATKALLTCASTKCAMECGAP
ncbi:MAG: hypothetical protein EXR75_12930 [Myxococcales bacterium]|nr:hypothetical protein [Myxococcales bacterium]